MNRLPHIWDIPLLLLLSMIWASSFTMIKIAVPDLGPMGVVFVRCAIGALFMLGIVLMAGINKTGAVPSNDKTSGPQWPRSSKEWGLLTVVGLISTAVPFYLVSFAEEAISSSMTAILMTTGPLAVIVLGHFFTEDEKINRGKLLGVFVGFAAAVYLLRGGLSGFDGMVSIWHPLAAMGAAVCYAIGGLLAKKMVDVSAEVIAFAVLAISALAVGPFYLLQDGMSLMSMEMPVIWAVLWLGLMPSGFAFYLRYFLIKRNGYGFVSYVGYLIPLFAIGIGMIVLNEQVTFDTVLAMIAILMGLFFTRGRDDFPWTAHPRLHHFRAKLN